MTKLLLDESVPIRLANHFPESFEVATVHAMGWLGTKNGELLRLAGEEGFEVLVTADRGIEHQQNELPCAVVVVRSYRTTLEHLIPLIPKIVALMERGSIHGIHHVVP